MSSHDTPCSCTSRAATCAGPSPSVPKGPKRACSRSRAAWVRVAYPCFLHVVLQNKNPGFMPYLPVPAAAIDFFTGTMMIKMITHTAPLVAWDLKKGTSGSIAIRSLSRSGSGNSSQNHKGRAGREGGRVRGRVMAMTRVKVWGPRLLGRALLTSGSGRGTKNNLVERTTTTSSSSSLGGGKGENNKNNT